ncbi:hypothetical protein BN12_1680006 [Nostocoides japonicum T1-X7]|uniref:DNA primase/polymerase bifunctional N-terminal domain-containing protein n=1 Tax=Nostocoides japonicum T1-X7 TaxID=1194083 RepID=A0A077LYT8_9MICO|nr:AAA family ATPase [Tetrasphaera japonica]CCH77140.1 hypothetical protein BN12_1680006 [Tetrasphaera japonica T1-X7]
MTVSGVALGNALIAAGIPVVVCTLCPPGCSRHRERVELHRPPGWNRLTARGCDLSGFREGVDVLAMVSGHGLDVVDVDTKAADPGSLDHLPPFERFGLVRTPSGGWHAYVRSTGRGKRSPFATVLGHVGDYCGGTEDGGGRMLVYLPGSSRPKYPEGAYVVEEPLDIAAALAADPDPTLTRVLDDAGASTDGRPGEEKASKAEMSAFLVEHEAEPACHYGRRALDDVMSEAETVGEGGRHGWGTKALLRGVELTRAGCWGSGDLRAVMDRFERMLPPERAGEAEAALRHAVANADGGTGCGMHDPSRAAAAVFGGAVGDDDPPVECFPRTSLRELLDPDRPPREYVVDPLITAGASVSFVAPPGARKSLLLLRLAIAVARGEPDFAGMAIPRGRRVLYVDMENTEDDWHERLSSFGVALGDLDDLGRFIPSLLPPMRPLDTEQGGEDLVAAVGAYGLSEGDLVVLDSYQRVTEAGENDSDTARAYYRHTGVKLKRLGLTVLRTDNTGKDVTRGARGTSSKRDDVDVEYLLHNEGGAVRLTRAKSRQRGADHVRIRVVEEGGATDFVWDDGPGDVVTADCARVLDDLGVPLSDGWRKAMAVLVENGHEYTRATVRDAVAFRKDDVI